MRRIINADDFGLTKGVNRGIMQAHHDGLVTSTTLMATGNAFDDAVALAKENPTLGIGVHLVLTTQKPLLSDHQTLVNEEGYFKYKLETIDEKLSLEETYREWRAQIEKVKAYLPITHFDSHHYMHFHEYLLPVAHQLAKEYQIPMRSFVSKPPMEIKSDSEFYGKNANYETLKKVINSSDDLLEIACHPAYVDEDLKAVTSYAEQRGAELQLLTGKIKDEIQTRNIQLIHFGEL